MFDVVLALEGTPTVVDNVISQVQPVITMTIDVMNALLANVLFQFLFACLFVKIGMNIFKKAKKAVK